MRGWEGFVGRVRFPSLAPFQPLCCYALRLVSAAGAVRLPRRRSASSVAEPGSAVKPMNWSPGSAVSCIAS